MKIPFFKFDHSTKEIEAVEEVIRSGWLTTASRTAEFERLFKEYCNTEYALAVNSCTSALHLALEATGVKAGDKVIVPTLTFTASAEVVRYLDADPIFTDVNPDTLLIEKRHIEQAVKKYKKIKACIVVNFGGQSVEMVGTNGIAKYCKKHGIKLIVDAAHSFPSFDSYGPVGSIGDITCFSFYANKTITTGEGGMLVTNNNTLAERMKVMRLHGIDRDVWDRFTSDKPSWEYDIIAPGYKYNMPDLNAAVGVEQFKRAGLFRDGRERCALRYIDNFKSKPYLTVVQSRVSDEAHAWHLFPIILNDKSHIQRDKLIELLTQDGIGTSVHYKPLHQMKYYQEKYKLSVGDFPNAEQYWKGCISLPIYHLLKNDEIDYICDRINSYLG